MGLLGSFVVSMWVSLSNVQYSRLSTSVTRTFHKKFLIASVLNPNVGETVMWEELVSATTGLVANFHVNGKPTRGLGTELLVYH